MDDKITSQTVAEDAMAQLISSASHKDFGQQVLRFLAPIVRFDSFGAFYIADLARPKPVLSLSEGRISQYMFRKDAELILGSEDIRDEILQHIRQAPAGAVQIERWHPTGDDPRRPLFQRAGVLERVGVSSRLGRGGFRSFFLRGTQAGWLSDAECAALNVLLPQVHALIGLRHRMVGGANLSGGQKQRISDLRARNAIPFDTLSRREAQVCDCLVAGLSVAGTAVELGIAESSVRTLRQRAYRKVGVNSATELVTKLIGDV